MRALDRTGNASPLTSAVEGIASLLVVGDIADGILDTAKFASSIAPVGLIAAGEVPASRSTDVIYHAPSRRILRWSGSAYTDTVTAGQIAGQITSTQISDGAITTPKIAANAITADELQANSVIFGKVAAGAIRSEQIAAGEVRAANLASDTLITQAAQLGSAVVGAAQIQNAAITAAKIGDAQVDSLQIAGEAATTYRTNGWSGYWVTPVDHSFTDGAATGPHVLGWSIWSPSLRPGVFVLRGFTEWSEGRPPVFDSYGFIITPEIPAQIGRVRWFVGNTMIEDIPAVRGRYSIAVPWNLNAGWNEVRCRVSGGVAQRDHSVTILVRAR